MPPFVYKQHSTTPILAGGTDGSLSTRNLQRICYYVSSHHFATNWREKRSYCCLQPQQRLQPLQKGRTPFLCFKRKASSPRRRRRRVAVQMQAGTDLLPHLNGRFARCLPGLKPVLSQRFSGGGGALLLLGRLDPKQANSLSRRRRRFRCCSFFSSNMKSMILLKRSSTNSSLSLFPGAPGVAGY